MIHPAQNHLLHQIALLLARLSLGIFLIKVAIGKVYEPGKSISQSITDWMTKYHSQTPSFIPGFIATPYGYAIPWLEIILGLLLVLGLFFRVTTLAITFLLISIAIAIIAQAGTPISAIHFSVVMATLSLLLFFTGPGQLSVDASLRKRRRR